MTQWNDSSDWNLNNFNMNFYSLLEKNYNYRKPLFDKNDIYIPQQTSKSFCSCDDCGLTDKSDKFILIDNEANLSIYNSHNGLDHLNPNLYQEHLECPKSDWQDKNCQDHLTNSDGTNNKLKLEWLKTNQEFFIGNDEMIDKITDNTKSSLSLDLIKFTEFFRQKRIKMGITQAEVGFALGQLKLNGFGSLSQSTICRFESLSLSQNNMLALKPILEAWLVKMEKHLDLCTQKFDQLCSSSSSLPLTTSPRPPPSSCLVAPTSINWQHPINLPIKRTIGSKEDLKRKRTPITGDDKKMLEYYFCLNCRPNCDQLELIAQNLNLKKNVVRIWFCNQRQKLKRFSVFSET